jgi:hypothetical protein
MVKLFLILSFLVFSNLSLAASTNAVGIVKDTGTYGSGRLFIRLDVQIDETECIDNRVDLPADHPQIKNWLSLAMVSLATQTPLVVRTTGCYGNKPTIDESTSGWIYIKAK